MRTHNYSLIILFALLLFSMISFVSFARSSSLIWSIQTVDNNPTNGIPSIALDSKNNPHIAYCSRPTGNIFDIMYASWDGSKWIIENVTCGRGIVSLVLDSNNNPHLTFDDQTGGHLLYAYRNSTSWNIQKVDDEGSDASVALDSSGNPHVAYLGNSMVLKYASRTGSTWDIKIVDPAKSSVDFNIDYGVFLALDSKDDPRILFGYDYLGAGSSTTVKYTQWNNSSGWVTGTVVSNIHEGSFGNLRVDVNGNPHFTYYADAGGKQVLIYASNNGSVWNSQVVETNINYKGPSYLGLDSNNYPYVDYFNSTPNSYLGKLMYSTSNGTAWLTQTIDSNSSLTAGPLIVDSTGMPHLAYLGNSGLSADQNTDIKYAVLAKKDVTATTNPTLVSSLLTPDVALILLISGLLILIGAAIVLYIRRNTRLPKA
jgi:hypothetical protein